MTSKRSLLLAGLVLLVLPWGSVQAGAYVGVYVGGPYCYRPYWRGGYYWYPPIVPIYVGPPAVVIGAPAPAVIVQQPAPIVAAQPSQSQSPSLETIPPPQPVPAPQPVPLTPVPASPSAIRPIALDTRGEIDQGLRDLSNSDANVRAAVALRLGRLKAHRAADSLEKVLAADPSPAVRDAAARGLGLIGLPGSIAPLQRAAQSDADQVVRNSAQYSIDVIRSR